MEIRVGQGMDIHPFGEGSSVILGGVAIPFSRGLVGHSDADALTHAIMDALLGAAGLPDIGHFFPNTDAQWKGASSIMLLRNVCKELSAAGWRVSNIDATVICEAPKIAPYLDTMKKALAEALGIDTSAVGIKATTAEKLGSIGRSEGIFCSAVALLTR